MSENSKSYKYFLKGDISGIQDFIFNVKSERASRKLKGRSFFIEAISLICIDMIEDVLGKQPLIFQNGGGNFYLEVDLCSDTQLDQIQKNINEACASEEFYVNITRFDTSGFNLNTGFGDFWKEIHLTASKDKLKRFRDFQSIFTPKRKSKFGDKYEDFTQGLIDSSKYGITPGNGTNELQSVSNSGIEILNYKFGLNQVFSNQNFTGLMNYLPRWDKKADLMKEFPELMKIKAEEEAKERKAKGKPPKKFRPPNGQVYEFSDFAYFAKQRTGSEKLGVLKMDIDHLGTFFKGQNHKKNAKTASRALNKFFGSMMLDFLTKESFKTINSSYDPKNSDSETHEKVNFYENIYPVFSGGDDLFFVGSWDAIFEFAHFLQKEFTIFKNANNLQSLSISAGLIVIDPKFPVIRFADEAEDALKKAKNRKDDAGKAIKNAVCVFGEVLTWEEFEFAKNTSNTIAKLIIHDKKSRAIFGRIKKVTEDFDRLQRSATGGKVPGPKVARLFYTMRELKGIPSMKKLTEQYSIALLTGFQKGKRIGFPKFPVAARWAEFLSRKK